jgi:hypothetical protein
MNQKLKQKKSKTLPLQEQAKYIKGIPESLRSILVPDENDNSSFSEKAKSLRIKEKERNYVMEIQRDYKLSLRPNESLKRTMIRVRLKMLRKKLKVGTKANLNYFKNLPVDPLE